MGTAADLHVARHRLIERLLHEAESNPSVEAMRRMMRVAGVQASRPDAGGLSAAVHRGVLLLGHAPRAGVPLHLRAHPPPLLVPVTGRRIGDQRWLWRAASRACQRRDSVTVLASVAAVVVRVSWSRRGYAASKKRPASTAMPTPGRSAQTFETGVAASASRRSISRGSRSNRPERGYVIREEPCLVIRKSMARSGILSVPTVAPAESSRDLRHVAIVQALEAC